MSHIIPKWMYKWAKAEGAVLGDYQTLGAKTKEQDGRKHYLLCDTCEQFLGEAERYTALLTSGERRHWKRIDLWENARQEILGIDHSLFQRFIYGVLFKAHHAPSVPFHTINLAGRDYILLRQMLRHDSYDEETFPIFLMRFESNEIPNADPKSMIFAVYRSFLPPAPQFTLLAAGWEWNVFFNRTGAYDGFPLSSWFLKYGEPLFAPIGDIVDQRFIEKRAKGNLPFWDGKNSS